MWFTMATILNVALVLMTVIYRIFWKEAVRRWNKEVKHLQADLKAAIKEIGVWSRKAGYFQAELEQLKDIVVRVDDYFNSGKALSPQGTLKGIYEDAAKVLKKGNRRCQK